MPASIVSIFNGALIKVGGDTITDPAEDSNRARALNARYESVRDAELRARKWKFSLKRASLAALAAAPDADFGKQYQLPVDFLRLVDGGDLRTYADMADFRGVGSPLYSIEGGKILTNLGAPLHIRYIARITDPALFDASFAEMLSSRLAFECCKRITGSDSEKETAWGDYKEARRAGIAANAIESPAESLADDSWILARSQ